ncbi:homeobox protein engrailed-1a-like [Dreissena polymorpha]|uniref:Homeobox domain-containing protein n=1 Tax=Dreissena polymorpha TaxID=45954 RepID=A0A9D3Y8R3_DREPO|nr:homeobox protein engrailed-1a-like [Dreissena polymorpha]KAH3694331.1 hypothetical protein DPMN_081771 [Dreissena polymorpha]
MTLYKSSRSVRYHPYNMPTSRSVDKAVSKINFLNDDNKRQDSSVISVFQVSSSELPIDSGNGSLTTTVSERQSTPSATDCSMTSLNSLSPSSVNAESVTRTPTSTARSSGSVSSSPQTYTESESSGDKKSDKKSNKSARTNYTKEQLKSLMKIFHDNTYPDSEMMENIAKDFGVKDTNIKIWFQNKVAQASGEHEQLDSVKHDARDPGTITNTTVRSNVQQLSKHAFVAEQRLHAQALDADGYIKSEQQHGTTCYFQPTTLQRVDFNSVSDTIRSVLPHPVFHDN